MCDRIVEGLLQRGLQRMSVVNDNYRRAWELARACPEQQLFLTDRLSFDSIERSGRLSAWSDDDDFAIIRLGPSRTTALTLVR
jgi:hypothetical protein